MAVGNFEEIWAAGGDVREPTSQEKATGFVSGPADPAVVNWLFQEQQELFNDLLDYTNSLTIVNDLAIYVPSQFATLQLALDYLADKRIAPPAIVRIFVSGDQTISSPLSLDHPNGNRINIIGESITTVWPSNTSIVADKATTTNTLRSIFPTRITCIGTSGLSLLNHSLGRVQNILFIGDGSVNDGIQLGSRDGQYGRAATYFDTVWVHGFGQRGVFLEIGSQLTGDRFGVSHNTNAGVRNARSQFRMSNFRSCRNSGPGLETLNTANSTLLSAIIANNGGIGCNTAFNAQLEAQTIQFVANTTYQCAATQSAYVNLLGATADESSTGTEYYASFYALLQLNGATGSTTASPTAGSVGNNGALISA